MSGPVGSGKSALVTAVLGQVNTCEVAAPGFLKRGGRGQPTLMAGANL